MNAMFLVCRCVVARPNPETCHVTIQVHVINEVFGFELQQDYKEGPYYRNERGTMVGLFCELKIMGTFN